MNPTKSFYMIQEIFLEEHDTNSTDFPGDIYERKPTLGSFARLVVNTLQKRLKRKEVFYKVIICVLKEYLQESN